MGEALKAGIRVQEFWDLTPAEVTLAIEAAVWQAEQDHRMRAWAVWHVAALSRTKRLPALSRLIQSPEAKPLSEEEAVERRSEFEEMSGRWNTLTPSPSPKMRGEKTLTPSPSPKGRGEKTLTPALSQRERGKCAFTPGPLPKGKGK